MIRKRFFISMVILICTIGLISCNRNEKTEINPIDMEVNIGQLPYDDLEKEWSVMNMDKYILRTAQQIWSTWSSVDKIWPGVDFSKYNVLYVSTDGENAWLINPKNEITKFSGKDLPDKFKATGEEMSFTSSEDPDKETQYLEAAKWWFNKYKMDNEKEYNMIKSIDILEGTARYFDMAVNVRSIKGMDISEDEVFKVYQNMVREDYTFSSDRFFGLPDEESYDIGGLCGIILEKQNNKEWKKESENGTPPLEILLNNYKQTPQEPSPEVKKIIEDIKLKREQLNNEEE